MKALLKKKSVLIAALAVLLIGTGVAATLAYLSSQTPTLTNTFTVGNVTTEIEEEFDKTEDPLVFIKKPKVKNIGANDCYVRARVVCSPQDALKLLFGDETDPKWEKIGDYYYYKLPLKPQSSTGPIFTGVEVTNNTIDGFEVTVYQEAVQTIVYRENDEPLVDPEPQDDDRSVMHAIWDWYDNGGKESSSNNS